MQPRRGSLSLAAALAAFVLPVLVWGVLQTSTSDGRVVASKTATASGGPPTSPTGRGTHAGRTHAGPPGKGVRPRGSDRHRHHRIRHRARLARPGRDERALQASIHNASDPGVAIADFSFSPGSITVHVGDSVVWSNNGPSPHTATANNGSFDTGVLNKGQSASVTFHLPGTFSYHCSIHPFMHGTVVVLTSSKTSSSGATGSSGGSSSSGSSGTSSNAGGGAAPSGASGSSGASGATSSSASAGQGALPMTGVDVVAVVVLGLAMSGAGLLLRRRGLG